MKVLVTGATGFVGGHLVDALLRRGDTVTALVRSRAKGEALAKRGVTPAPGDLADDAALRAAARGQEVVYHLAGLVAAHSEAEFQTVNADGTARLVAAVAAGAPSARLVLVSSMAAAGPSPAGGKLTGTEPARPVTAYGRSKLAGERAVAEGPLPWTILRPPAVYGPGDLELLRVFKATAFGVVPVFGGGGQELSMVYGPDLGEAIAAAGHAANASGGVYYPCHEEVLTSTRLVEAIAHSVGRKARVVGIPRWAAVGALAATHLAARLTGRATLLTPDKANEFFAPAWVGDPKPLEHATGWRAGHDFSAGAALTVAWYRGAGLL